MKYLLAILMLAVAFPAAGQLRLEVEFVGAKLVSNDSVGNEWSTAVYAGLPGGVLTHLERGRIATFETTSDILIKAQAIQDGEYPDYREASRIVRLIELTAGEPKTVTLDVVVREDQGRDLGDNATWRFEVRVLRQ